SKLSRLDLVAHMLGRTPEEPRPGTPPGEKGEPVLDAKGLSRRGLEPFDLAMGAGEVVGFAGLLGSGRTEAARLLFGADAAKTGTVNGRTLHSPRQAIALGMGLCPEDRKLEGIVPDMSIRENIALVIQQRLGIFVSRAEQERIAREYVEKLGIKTPSIEQPIRLLSGGNQQKVILARWLAARPRLLILDEPTRGIDVGAKAEIERVIDELASQGLSVLFISAALEEVARLSHRVAIFRDRKLVGEYTGMALPEIMKVIAGEKTPDDERRGAA
ncbi:MAG TPA: ATP-binding cassette domain-containing protein, partial [Archangium sp.]|nr:ATP-binding cassette domain-containing protein [Archangium sp.]